MQTSRKITLIATLILLLGSAAGLFIPQQSAMGQAASNPWSQPINLSNSGGTTQPAMVIDSNGVFHVIWEDIYAQFAYSSSEDGENWSVPTELDLPFYGFSYRLIASDNGRIFAFWMNDDGDLLVRQVDAQSFGFANRWSGSIQIGTAAVKFDVSIDEEQRLHVAYLQAASIENRSPGIYYTFSASSGLGWSVPKPVYESLYLRNLLLTETNRQAAATDTILPTQVDIEASGALLVIAWDHPILKRVYYTRSFNGGEGWESETVVDGPSLQSPYQNPSSIQVSLQGQSILLLWNIKESGGLCIHRYQSSNDGGETWQPTADVMEENQVCLGRAQLVHLPDGQTLLFGNTQSQTYLLAFDGSQWSPLQEQSALMNLVDQLSYTFVQPGCQSTVLTGETLWMINCDQGSGGDIWIASRSIEGIEKWFEVPEGWAALGATELNPLAITSLAAAAQADGSVHAFWSEANTSRATSLRTDILYAQWKDNELLGPYPVIEGVDGVANQLAVTNGSGQRFYAIWSGGQSGQVQISWATTEQVNSPSAWAEPQYLQGRNLLGRSPLAAIDPDGSLAVVYAVPLNDQRGVYLVKSADGGQNWSNPVQVFDAASAGCEMVERPYLSVTAARQYNIMWSCSTAPGGVGPLELYAAHSPDGGDSWTPAETIVSRPVYWNQMSAYASNVHRVWKEVQAGRTSLWHAISSNGGESWEAPKNIWVSDSITGLTSLSQDSAGQLHLVQVVQEENELPKLMYLRLEGVNWVPDVSLALPSERAEDITALASVIDSDSRLVVVSTGFDAADIFGIQHNRLLFNAIAINVPENGIQVNVPQIEPTPAEGSSLPTPAPTTDAADTPDTEVLTPTETAVPTQVVTIENSPTSPAPGATATIVLLDNTEPGSNNATVGLILGSVFAMMVIAAVVVVNVNHNRKKRF